MKALRPKLVPNEEALKAVAEQWKKRGLEIIPGVNGSVEGWKDGHHICTAKISEEIPP